ncbi:GNAT family N-acetyltransferase [candidate division KSB1 bacterium]|nr:GNAT family N-acetyltransferase [candidate division KSB1 bacterium]NIR72093.1 GNAT family N-acetyltransferase [candidate division KSB1 bacterium]NIS24357.1 GNAT family N-acetyltransferase [candidate division KSB1 bacterium]NIT71289.1 GNAT family N-acetyltransferase [candidate division KSB1 bacterium]NIU24990.1 GNAT family N-acetyltransferase [candidate division KSB1 bacterium]
MTTESVGAKIERRNLSEIEGSKWHVRSYNKGDEHQILELWRLVFHHRRSLEHWRWKFQNNPYLEVQAALAYTPFDQKIVGQYTVLPVRINFRGDSLLGSQVVDLMTHPDVQRQGISLKTAQHCYEALQTNDVSIVFSFFSKTSYPGHVKRLGSKPITPLKQYWLRLNIYSNGLTSKINNFFYSIWLRFRLFKERFVLKHLQSSMTFRLSRDATFHQSKTVPHGYDELWHTIRPYEVLSIWKDSEYLRWRYDQNPDREFDYFYLVEGKQIIALAVVTAEAGSDVTICELLARDRNVLNSRMLIGRILSYYRDGPYRKIRFIGHDIGFFDEVFDTFRSEIWFSIVFCARVFESPELEEYIAHPSNWTLTYGDIDLV